jgi:hypothetical protein
MKKIMPSMSKQQLLETCRRQKKQVTELLRQKHRSSAGKEAATH